VLPDCYGRHVGPKLECVETLAKILLGAAAVLAMLGGVLLLASKLGIGRLPGDILIRRGNFTFYAPVGLMILLSLVLTVVLNVLLRR
jgi:Protein of unknown function (DUF2905)